MNTRAVLGGAALVVAALLSLSACSTDTPPKQEPLPTASTKAEESASATPTPTPAAGTRANPIPIDTLTEYSPESMWNFSVGATNPDATADVLATNQFNTAPADGSVFILAPFFVTVKPEAPAEGADVGASISIEYVSPQGNSYNFSNAPCGVAPGTDIYMVGNMYPGAQANFNTCVAVPRDAVAGGAWRVASNVDATASIFLQGAP